MPLVQVNVKEDAIADHAIALNLAGRAAERLPRGGTVILMAHGYKFSPFHPVASPHRHILSLAPRSDSYKALSWPEQLGVGAPEHSHDRHEPLCVAIGWQGRTSPWQAYRNAARAGRALVDLVRMIRTRRPDLQITALSHSMGARVILSLLSHLPAGAIGRAVLLAPAEMGNSAAAFLDTPGGRSAEVLCVTSRENLVFEHLLAWTVGPHRLWDTALGHHKPTPHARWLHMRIDDPDTRGILADLGYPVAAPNRRVCHWSVYLRAGVFPIYRDVLTGALPLRHLKGCLPQPDAIGTHAAQALRFGLPLPLAGKASS